MSSEEVEKLSTVEPYYHLISGILGQNVDRQNALFI